MRGRGLSLVLLVAELVVGGPLLAAPPRQLFTAVDAARLFGAQEVRRRMVLVDPCSPSPGIVSLEATSAQHRFGLYGSLEAAVAVCYAFHCSARNGGEPLTLHGRARADWAWRCPTSAGDGYRIGVRWANLVWIVEAWNASLAEFEERAAGLRARLDNPEIASRGTQVPVPNVQVHAGGEPFGPVVARRPGQLAYEGADNCLHCARLTRGSAGRALPLEAGSTENWSPSADELPWLDAPGVASQEAWFATSHNVVFPVRTTFTVLPGDADTNGWLTRWAVQPRPSGPLPPELQPVSRYWHPVASLRRVERLSADSLALRNYVRAPWLPRPGLSEYYDGEDRREHRSYSHYQGGLVRLAWRVDEHGDHLFYVEQDLNSSRNDVEVEPYRIFWRPEEVSEIVSHHTLDGSTRWVRCYILRCHPRPLWQQRRTWTRGLSVIGLWWWLRRRRRRPRARQRF